MSTIMIFSVTIIHLSVLQCAGAIIGARGCRIRQIRTQSRATIKIEDSKPDSNERIISITGTDEQIGYAQYLLQERYVKLGVVLKYSLWFIIYWCHYQAWGLQKQNYQIHMRMHSFNLQNCYGHPKSPNGMQQDHIGKT